MSQLIVENNDTWRFSGELSFVTVGYLLTEFSQRISQSPPKVIDLAEVTRTDSAGLALLIEILKQMKDQSIAFRHIPSQMLTLAQVSGVQEILTGHSVP